MNAETISFFGEHRDALPLYEGLEEQILPRSPM